MGMDMSDAFGGEMMDSFSVKRRTQTVDPATGRGVESIVTIPDLFGVITSAHGNDLDRLPEADRMGRNLSVVTKHRLIGPAKDFSGTMYKPDIIVWRGDEYVVKSLDPYPQFGPGFYQALCGSVNVVDQVI